MQKYPVEIVGYGVNDGILQQVDPTHDAARLSIRPLEHVIAGMIGGHYAMVATYSNTAAKPAAGSDVFSMRWTDSRYYFVLLRLTAFSLVTTAYTAAGAQDLALYAARDFSVSPSGGTQVMWVSSGDLLTTGTRTLDTQPIGYFQYANPAAAGSPASGELFDSRDFSEHPLVLTANEGLVVQTPIGNAQAAGVSKYGFRMEWAEVGAF